MTDTGRLPEKAASGAKLAGLVFIPGLARLDLYRCGPFGHQRIEPRQRLRDQLILGGGAGRLHGGKNAAAGARNSRSWRPRDATRTRARGTAVDEVGWQSIRPA